MRTEQNIEAGERTQHTPGPWTVNGPYIEAEESITTIASVSGFDFPRVRESEANARLIAAAPELLDFVRDYFEQADCGDGGEHDEDMSHGRCWHCTARRLVTQVEVGN